MSNQVETYGKAKVAIKYWLLGRKYYQAEKALEFAVRFHDGYRKDKVTPEFYHQVTMALYARVFDGIMMYPQETFAAIFLHDIMEDKDISYEEIKDKFGELVAEAVRNLSRKFRGKKIPIEEYYHNIMNDPIASVGKGIDRINNMQTMVDVFTLKGQKWYIEETQTYILPALKHARINFVEQERIYVALKQSLDSQVQLISAIHKAQGI
jgi:(p)ppGpp synthase/HD superfamily hydrolase